MSLRLQAPRSPVPLGPIQDLAQDQEPGGAGKAPAEQLVAKDAEPLVNREVLGRRK
jgi:hypothetical protein